MYDIRYIRICTLTHSFSHTHRSIKIIQIDMNAVSQLILCLGPKRVSNIDLEIFNIVAFQDTGAVSLKKLKEEGGEEG